MSSLVQIIYISRSASAPAKPANGVDPVVARILAHSRTNNRRNGLVGVLYFGDGCFFQCLEGEETAVDTLYKKLEQDNRHRDLKIISRNTISAPTFKDWSMKYVATEKEMAALLRRNGMGSFDPYLFNDAVIQQVIDLLHNAAEPATAKPGVAAPVPQPTRPVTPNAAAPRQGWGVKKLSLLGVALVLVAGGVWTSMAA